MIKKGDYTINDIKSFFRKGELPIISGEDIEVGDLLEMRISENPAIDLSVEVIDIVDGLLVVEIFEIVGDDDEHSVGEILYVPLELLK